MPADSVPVILIVCLFGGFGALLAWVDHSTSKARKN